MRFSTKPNESGQIGLVTFNHRLSDTSISTVINPYRNERLENGYDIRFVFEDTIELYTMRDTLNALIEYLEKDYATIFRERGNASDK